MMMTMIMMMIIVKLTLKCAIREFQKSPHCAANCVQHAQLGQGAVACKFTKWRYLTAVMRNSNRFIPGL